MKKELPQSVVVTLIVVVVLIVAGVYYFSNRGQTGDMNKVGLLKPGEKPIHPHLGGGGNH